MASSPVAATVVEPTAESPATPQQQDEAAMDVEQFEPILSDEEIVDESDAQFQDLDYEMNEDEENSKAFNPFTCELQPLIFLPDPCLSPCEAHETLQQRVTLPVGMAAAEDAARLEELIAEHAKARASGGVFVEDWVHWAEQIPPLLTKALPAVTSKQDTVSSLISWIRFGTDLETALSQPQPSYKVRHLKAGLRLAEALCLCGERYVRLLLDELDLHALLLHLYRRDYMALSVKLMIVRVLDATLSCRYAMDGFLRLRILEADSEPTSGYRVLVGMALGKELARVKFALDNLLRKIHVWEMLGQLHACAKQLADGGEADVETLFICLEEVARIHRDAAVLLAQPKRFLPVSAQFEIGGQAQHEGLYAFFRCHRLLEILLVLLSCPLTSCYSTVVGPAHDMLRNLLDTAQGMHFLAHNAEVSTALVRLLLASDEVSEEISCTSPSQQLGLQLAYRLQTLHHLDVLLGLQMGSRYVDPDSSVVLDTLHDMYCLGGTAAGRQALMHVISRGNNVKTLLRFFLQPPGSAEPASKTPGGKSPGKGYAADLLLLTVKCSDHVPMMQQHGRELVSCGLREDKTRLHEVLPWLRCVVDNPACFHHHDITALCDVLSRNVDDAASLPGELITALRILKHLAVQADEQELGAEEYHQLKYKYVVLKLFSMDGIAHLTSALLKVCGGYEQPALHSASFLGSHGAALCSLVLPAVQLLRRMLMHVIRCRNTHFKDLTAVPALLRTFSLMNAFPVSAHAYAQAQRACREVVETLLAYTQPIAAESENNALHKSLWTLMMGETVRYVTTGPHTFVPGLLILSELLPLPLPVHTRTALPDSEVQRTVNARKLWSAHLHALSGPLQEMIAAMCGSGLAPLLQLLRRVCVQLADLAPPTALIVSRAVLDTILQQAEHDASHTARLLNFLACLVSHPAVKAAVLFLLSSPVAAAAENSKSAVKGDERYAALIPSMCAVLRRVSDLPCHVQAQECVVSIVQTLCDVETSLVVADNTSAAQDTYLSNSLPCHDLLVVLCTALLDHVSDTQQGNSTLLPAVRTFLMLAEHDYGLYHLRACLDKSNMLAMRNLFLKFYTGFSTLNNTLHCALATSLELLRTLISTGGYEEALLPPRTLAMSVRELAKVLDWNEGEGEEHPVRGLDKLLRECGVEEEALESLQENVSCLIRLLEEEGSKQAEGKEWVEPIIPPPDTLLAQFSARPVFVLGDVEEERLSSSYWLAPPPVDDIDQDVDQVTCDLLEVTRELLPDYELCQEAEQLCRLQCLVPAPDDSDLDADLVRKSRDHAKGMLAADTRNKRPFVAPMRGRGFGRATPQRGDLFRSRPPNTSRPPSLHVDDFVALESSGQQPTGPTGYNKLSMRAAKDMMCVRGRGRGRAFPSERGRFFNVSTAMYRRENGRGGGGTSWTDSGLPNNNQPSPQQQQQQRNFRSPEARTPRSDEKFPRFVGGRGVRPPGGSWPLKDHRGPNSRGGPRREPIRHVRTFTR